jgi:hypothetical protein
MMIVSVTRDPRDVMAIRESGVRATLAATVSAGLEAALRPEVRLIVCDVPVHRARNDSWSFRDSVVPCPLLLRHDLDRRAIDALYDMARTDADIRSSFRQYDDLRLHLTTGGNAGNATRAILRALPAVDEPRLRDFIAIMAVLGERPVMQAAASDALGLSTSAFRAWLGDLRRGRASLPPFPRLNAHFVAAHLLWRRGHLGWSTKRAAAAAGFADEKACANYLRYHLAATASRLLREGGFDARVTVLMQLFGRNDGARLDAVRRI